MKRNARIVILALTGLLLLAGCNNDPVEGDPCGSPGSVYVHGSVHLYCNRNGVWSK